jgi:hypothetical protein
VKRTIMETLKEIIEQYYDVNRVEDDDDLIRRAYEAGFDACAELSHLSWINEDELPKRYPYKKMFPFSKLGHDRRGGVRLFPELES